MQKNVHVTGLCLLLLLCFSACKDDVMKPLTSGGPKPQMVSNLQVENIAGGANLIYTLPKDENLLYIKATYETNGEQRESKASYYTDTLLIDGFPDTLAHDVKVYAISRTEVASDPVTVTIHPKTAPVLQVYQSIVLQPDFGGVRVDFTNPSAAPLAIIVLADTSASKKELPVQVYYTKELKGHFSVRGLSSVPTKFGVTVRDHWSHFSDTLYQNLTPVYEKELDKSLFQQITLPSDQEEDYGWDMSNLWNNTLDGDGWHTKEDGKTIPEWFSFDLGVDVKLSRFKFWQRGGSYLYTHGNPKEFEIWGTENPAPDGSFDGWTRLDSCSSIKPSGSPLGVVTQQDQDYAAAGEEYIFPIEIPKVRYIRFKTIRNWSGTSFVHMMEITFWGSDK